MKRLLFLLSLAILLLGACGNKKEEYKNSLQGSIDEIMNSSLKAESLVDNYSSVWNYSIKSKSTITVSSMALKTGLSEDDVKDHFPVYATDSIRKDFSANIHALKSYYEASGDIAELEESLEKIKVLISDLKSPPEEFQEVYNEVLDLYNLSDEYIRMAVNPSGSLQDYNADKKRLTTEILNTKKRIEVVMPD